MTNKNLKEIGFFGENFAEKYLQDKGFLILEKNFTVWGGEIDICAFKDGKLHIVEVKTSQSTIRPEEHLDFKKLKTIAKMAEYYFSFKLKKALFNKGLVSYETKDLEKFGFCIDVICIQIDKDFQVKSFNFLENIEI